MRIDAIVLREIHMPLVRPFLVVVFIYSLGYVLLTVRHLRHERRLMLALLSLVNPGEEVIVFDPYFVMYDSLSKVVGGHAVHFDTYPDFRIDLGRLADTITPRTKAIIFNSPGNPPGVVPDEATVRGLAELAARKTW